MDSAATHAKTTNLTTPTTAAGTSPGMPTSTPATTTTILGEDKMMVLDTRNGRPAHLQIRPHRRHRILRWRRHPERLTRPTATSNRGLAQHHTSLQVTTKHGEITNGVATIPPATMGAPMQAIHRAVPPGSAGSRLLLLDRTQPPAPTTQADKTCGDPTLLLLAQLPPRPLHHLTHGWRARQAAQPLQPLRSLHARRLQPPRTPTQRPGTATVAPPHMIHGWQVQQAARPPQPLRLLRVCQLQPP